MSVPLDPECELTGLATSGCAHCRPAPPLPRAERVIYARFDGHCGICDDAVRVGDPIGLFEGEWLCSRCYR